MGVFDGILGNWIQIKDDDCKLTIMNYDYKTGVIKGTTGNHCRTCVVVNQCWFKNETGKKPEINKASKITEYTYSDMDDSDFPGLFHPHCHCEEIPIPDPDIEDIKLIIVEGKYTFLFADKAGLMKSCGYPELNNDFIETYNLCVKKAYYYGNYAIQFVNEFGVRIRLFIDLPGGGEKNNKTYPFRASFMIFPNGTLKCNTPMGGWQK